MLGERIHFATLPGESTDRQVGVRTMPTSRILYVEALEYSDI